MTNNIVFLTVTAFAILYGSVFTLKYFGWPSAFDRKNKIVRALKTGFSSTVMVIGVMLIYFYWTAPEVFWSQWTITTIIGSFFFFVVPMFCVLTISSLVQFSVWEKTEVILKDQLRRVVKPATKGDKQK